MQQYAVTNVSSKNITTIITTDDILTSVYVLGVHNLFCGNCGDIEIQQTDLSDIGNSSR